MCVITQTKDRAYGALIFGFLYIRHIRHKRMRLSKTTPKQQWTDEIIQDKEKERKRQRRSCSCGAVNRLSLDSATTSQALSVNDMTPLVTTNQDY